MLRDVLNRRRRDKHWGVKMRSSKLSGLKCALALVLGIAASGVPNPAIVATPRQPVLVRCPDVATLNLSLASTQYEGRAPSQGGWRLQTSQIAGYIGSYQVAGSGPTAQLLCHYTKSPFIIQYAIMEPIPIGLSCFPHPDRIHYPFTFYCS